MTAPVDWLTQRPIAHRGLHDGNVAIWENTLGAFDAAIKRNFAIEMDVQLSADGRAMVFHDAKLERLTQHKGAVVAHDATTLAGFSIGGTADKMPTLARTLTHIGDRVPLVIEMKDNGSHNGHLAKAVAEDLDGYAGRAAAMSFAQDLVAAFAAHQTGRPVGLTAEGIGSKAMTEHEKAIALGVDFVSYHVKALPNPFVQKVRSMGLPVITWTVRTPEDVALTRTYADQMTFEGFDPDTLN